MNDANAYQVGQLTTAPLGALIPARDGNARKKKRTRERIRRMAVSIHMHGGVLQNLVVVPEERDGKQTGRLEVVAGETRRLGLCALRDGWIEDAKGYTDDFPVPILVRALDEAPLPAPPRTSSARTCTPPTSSWRSKRWSTTAAASKKSRRCTASRRWS